MVHFKGKKVFFSFLVSGLGLFAMPQEAMPAQLTTRNVLLQNAKASDGMVELGVDESLQGTVIACWRAENALSKGIISIDSLDLGQETADVVIEASPDGFYFGDYLFGQPVESKTGLRFALPASYKGQKEVFLRIRATKGGGSKPAATIKGLRLEGIEEESPRESNPWRVSEIDPWIETDAEALPGQVTALKARKRGEMVGLKNDWLSGSWMISAPYAMRLQVELETPDALKGKMEMRVVGQSRNPNGGISWDAIFSAEQVAEYGKDAFNYAYIKDFPTLALDRSMPAWLWFTADLRGVPSGEYESRLVIQSEDGIHKEIIILNITVLDDNLPEANPLYVITWNSWTGDAMQDMIDHGVNVAWRNHEEAWKRGARFLLFQFVPTFDHNLTFDPSKRNEIAAELDKIRSLVARLRVPKDQWAINVQDEVCDARADVVAKYSQLIKELRPDVPIWQNPLYGGAADAVMQGHTSTIDGTIRKIEATTDFYCPYAWHLPSPMWSYLKKTGKRLWFYEIWLAAGRNPAVGREAWRTMPYMAWHYGAEGFGVYALNDATPNAYRGPAVHASVIYPGGERPISSRSYEALRQGIQEYKLLKLLQQKGVKNEVLDAWVEMAIAARSPEVITTVRTQMITELKKLSKEQ